MVRVLRLTAIVIGLGLLLSPLPVEAAASQFDLLGPRLAVAVTHDGVTLPLDQVPNLSEGDRISVSLELPPGENERYRMVAVFLRGAIARPPDDWFHEADTRKPGATGLSLVVPGGAQQLALFISPERGGGRKTINGTIRKQPGAFVRAVQELNQASLDRSRLDAFLRGLQKAERADPASVAKISPILTRSLAIKLNAECFQRPAELQAACLAMNRETLLLADSHSSSLAATLAGTPTDLAFQLSATPQAGYGAYSSYIGVVRDIFRLFGAFQTTELQFIPTLLQMGEDRATILLNAPLSFAKPTSVMVVALPQIEAPTPPPLRRAADAMLCAKPGLVLPVEGAPLIYATRYAHSMALRIKLPDGTEASVPLRADAAAGGFVAASALPAIAAGTTIEGQVHGQWGFAPFDGPSFALSTPGDDGWKVADRSALVVGRSNQIDLTGSSIGCVVMVGMRRADGSVQPLTWKPSGQHAIAVTVPLENEEPGPVSLLVDATGRAASAEVTLRALQQTGSLDDLDIHAGDPAVVLTGTRLDQVVGLSLGGVVFEPGALTRAGKRDQLTLTAADPAQAPAFAEGKAVKAEVSFTGGRRKTLSATVAPRRSAVELVRVTAQVPARAAVLPITLPASGVFPQDARLTFAFHMGALVSLSGRETIEVATLDGHASTVIEAGKGYDLQDATTGIVSFAPAEGLGPGAHGALRFRVVRKGEASDWAPLATIVRLPEIRSVACKRDKDCTLSGSRIFLIKTIGNSADLTDGREVPDGFVATEIKTPPARDGKLYLRLRDAPELAASVVAR